MKKFKIGMRLGLGFGLVLVLMAGLALMGMNSMSRIHGTVQEIVGDNVYKMSLVQDMSESVHIVSRVTRTTMLLKDDAAIQTEIKKIEDERSKYDAAVAALEKTPASEKGRAIRARMREARLAARPLNNKVLQLAKEHKTDEALEILLKEAAPATQKWQEALDENIAFQHEVNKRDAEAADEIYANTRLLMLSLLAVSMLVGVSAAYFITRSIVRPMEKAVKVAQTVAAGDLTSRIDVDSMDETGQLLLALKNMNESLVKIVGEVRGGTETIASASQQIASGTADLSSRTEEQASSLEETASSMEELTSTVKQNADNARQAKQLATTASDVAVKGGAVVSEVVGTMGAINESARKIVDIIGVIDGIAFQTNILALNAAVEAARAGEQGRGFAVVASEVRNLAQRSAAAAKEIKVLIDNSVEKVDAGSKLVDQAGATMQEVVESIRRVTDIMAEISAASQEQTTGIEQVNQAISQMDQVTQQNAALVEESAAASEAMQDQAGKLAQVVGTFKIAGMQAAARTNATQPAKKTPSSAAQVKRLAAASSTRGNDWEEF